MFLGLSVFIAGTVFLGLFGNSVLGLFQSIDTRFVPLSILAIIAITEILDLHASYHATIYTSTNHVPFVLPATISGALIIAIGFFTLPIYGLLGIVVTKFVVQWFMNNWYAPMLSLRLLKWPFLNYLYQFPVYGFQFVGQIVRENLLKRK